MQIQETKDLLTKTIFVTLDDSKVALKDGSRTRSNLDVEYTRLHHELVGRGPNLQLLDWNANGDVHGLALAVK